MKKLIGMFVFLLASALLMWNPLSGQEHVDEELRVKQWVDGQTLEIFGHPVTRVFGETYDRTDIRNYHIPITNVGYKTMEQLIDDLKTRAGNEEWSDAKLAEKMNEIKENAPGGRIYVYIERRENDRANGKYFFVVVRDEDEKDIYRESVGNNPPQFGDFGFWGNLFTVNLPEKPPFPFYVDVNDRKSDHLTDFRFMVEK